VRPAALFLLTFACQAQTVKIGVFSLFHSTVLQLAATPHQALRIEIGGTASRLVWPATVRIGMNSGPLRITEPCDFVLSVPGRIERRFHGTLSIQHADAELIAVIEMDRETAVASIVAAESPPGAPLEALKVQAVVARSFLIAAGRRHETYDFCDTTHCQFLREPPQSSTLAARATRETRGLGLTYEGKVIEALYSANCGGGTRTLADARLKSEGYPYFAVPCPAEGEPSGHRIGLCQNGAAIMAGKGIDFRDILMHYFPAAVITSSN
jgi:peptidoglycan hydrolase-like amidase